MAKAKRTPRQLWLMREHWFCPVCQKGAIGCYILHNWDEIVPPEFQEYVIHYNCLITKLDPSVVRKLKPTGYRKESVVARLRKLEELYGPDSTQVKTLLNSPDSYEPFNPDKEFVGPSGFSVSFMRQIDDTTIHHLHLQFSEGLLELGERSIRFEGDGVHFEPMLVQQHSPIGNKHDAQETAANIIKKYNTKEYNILYSPGDTEDYGGALTEKMADKLWGNQ